ncbi:MAG: hypothetical protein R2845_00070 [Thermomicrobiales bacterium]
MLVDPVENRTDLMARFERVVTLSVEFSGRPGERIECLEFENRQRARFLVEDGGIDVGARLPFRFSQKHPVSRGDISRFREERVKLAPEQIFPRL